MLKYFLLFILIFVCTIKFNAQTLTAANYDPVIGETFDYGVQGAFTLSVGSAGTNKLWDFSSVLSTNDFSSSTVVSNNNATVFPQASFVKKDNLNMSGDYYSYFKSTSNGIEALGYGYFSSPLIYPGPLMVMPYPFYLGVQSTDSYSYSGSVYSQTLTADATGTLITCIKTYTNVLRAHFTKKNVTPSLLIIEDGYAWYTPDTHTEIYVVRATTNNLTVYSPIAMIYNDQSIYTGLTSNESEIDQIKVYPVPVESTLNIQLQNSKNKDLRFKLIDLTGSEMNASVMEYSESEIKIQMNELLPGIYLLKVMNKDQVLFIRRIIKS